MAITLYILRFVMTVCQLFPVILGASLSSSRGFPGLRSQSRDVTPPRSSFLTLIPPVSSFPSSVATFSVSMGTEEEFCLSGGVWKWRWGSYQVRTAEGGEKFYFRIVTLRVCSVACSSLPLLWPCGLQRPFLGMQRAEPIPGKARGRCAAPVAPRGLDASSHIGKAHLSSFEQQQVAVLFVPSAH